MFGRTARVIALAAALLASVGELSHGLCFMKVDTPRPHACCGSPANSVRPSCCHGGPTEPVLASLTAPLHTPAAARSDAIGAIPLEKPIDGWFADRGADHSPPPPVLRI